MSKIDKLLVEKYRPATVADYVFTNTHTRENVEKWIANGSFPNVLLCGSPGTGKNSLAYILINTLGIEPSDVKHLNASRLKASVIDDELVPWMRKAPLGRMKVVILDEADGINAAGQRALRYVIEEYSDTVRFIATCNYKNLITEALHSRFQMLELDSMDADGVIDYIINMIESENLTFDDPSDVMSHIDTYTPDLRKIINSIDQHTNLDKVVRAITSTARGEDLDAWENLWASKEFQYQTAIELIDYVDPSNFEEFYAAMYNNSYQFGDIDAQSRAIILLSEYLERAMNCANQRLHLHAFLIRAFMMED